MERMWAPWRIDWILSGDDGQAGCLLCRLYEAGPSREGLVLHCDSHSMVMLNRYPYAGGHLMVVPRSHGGALTEIPLDVLAGTTATLQKTVGLVQEVMKPDGANIGMNLGRSAGAGIADHAHWHVLPRWQGDTNFMPMVAGVRVVNESLFSTWDTLRPHFAAWSTD